MYKAALDKKVMEYFFRPRAQPAAYDLDLAFEEIFERFAFEIRRKLVQRQAVKFLVKVGVWMDKFDYIRQEQQVIEMYYSSENKLVLTHNQIEPKLREAIAHVLARYDNFLRMGSGWTLSSVDEVVLSIATFTLFKGGCLTQKLPDFLKNTRGIIRSRVKNSNFCFVYALVLGLNRKRKKRPFSKISKMDMDLLKKMPLNLLNFPVTLRDVQRFEKEATFSINIYGYDWESEKQSKKNKKVIFPYYVSDFINERNDHVDLLMFENHYYAIHNMSALLAGKSNRSRRRRFVCQFCLSLFATEKKFTEHKTLCTQQAQRYSFPKIKKYKKFTAFSSLVELPFVIYADLESCIRPAEKVERGKQISTSKHECISWAALTVCRSDPDLGRNVTVYTGKNPIKSFLEYLEEEFWRIQDILQNYYVPLIETPESIQDCKKAKRCKLCGRTFRIFTKYRDHDHLNGKYRGTLCNGCNFNRARTKHKLVVVFHGLSNYDSHFIIQKLHKYAEDELKVIPRTAEKYLSFSISDLIFKDSYQFLSDSLQNLAANLKSKGEENFFYMRRHFEDPTHRKFLYAKGIFPYTYIKDLSVLSETSLPPAAAFFNDLTQSPISSQEYALATQVWNVFGCRTLQDYLELYLVSDVLLLADVFESFRSNCIHDYQLDPIHFFSLPHFTFDAFLRFSSVSFELLSDVNQYLLFSKMIRGGLSVVSKRFAQANNRLSIPAEYDPQKASKYILYLDANSLYPWAMQQNLPYRGFKWRDHTDCKLIFNILCSSDLKSKGYVLLVDLDYPAHLHDMHNDYPLAPEKCNVSFEDLSPYAKDQCLSHSLRSSLGTTKLLNNLGDKRYYAVYYKTLRLYINLGLVLKKVHKILEFEERPIMKDYIEFNAKKRQQATNNFDISFYKFLSNSLFGKTMERPENKSQLKLVTKIETYERMVSRLNFKQFKIINPHLVALEMKYPIFHIEKPFYVGTVILELAKWKMYDFHYNIMKKYFANKIQLLYTDTDSFIYEIESDDVYADLAAIQKKENVFDFSSYPKDHPLFSATNKKVPGFFKDETNGLPIHSFVGLRSKMYSLKLADLNEIKHAKGVKANVIDRKLNFQHYKDCLFESTVLNHDFRNLRSVGHSVFTSHQTKVSLSCFDDKRWLHSDGVHSFAYNHWRISEQKKEAGAS